MICYSENDRITTFIRLVNYIEIDYCDTYNKITLILFTDFLRVENAGELPWAESMSERVSHGVRGWKTAIYQDRISQSDNEWVKMFVSIWVNSQIKRQRDSHLEYFLSLSNDHGNSTMCFIYSMFAWKSSPTWQRLHSPLHLFFMESKEHEADLLFYLYS